METKLKKTYLTWLELVAQMGDKEKLDFIESLYRIGVIDGELKQLNKMKERYAQTR